MAWNTVTFVGAIGITIGWLLASTLTPPVAQVQSLPPSATPPRTTRPPVAPATEQLQRRLEEVRPAPENRRNPFVFAARSEASRPTAQEAEKPLVPSADSPQVPSGPSFVLSGIGVSGSERTAILAANDTVHIVRVNDLIGGFTVVDITDESITLTRGDEPFVLRLAH